MSAHNRERRKHGARRAPEVIVAEFNAGPGPPLPAVQAFVAQHRHTFRPGLHQIVTMHDATCGYPGGHGACICSAGPEIRIVGVDPTAN